MVGIAAIFGTEDAVFKMKRMLSSISHRNRGNYYTMGGNSEGLKNSSWGAKDKDPNTHILRKSLQRDGASDLSPIIICDASIYNLTELQSICDPKANHGGPEGRIVQLYKQYGIKYTAQRIDGEFAACIVDFIRKEVHLLRDTLGIRPLFRALGAEGELVICSEAKGILTVSQTTDKFHGKSIEPFPSGCFESYQILPSGNVKLMERSQFRDVGCQPLHKSPVTLTEPDTSVSISSLLTSAVKKRLVGASRVACLLSGGLDSSLIAGLVAREWKILGKDGPILTFNVALGENNDPMYARKVAEHIGSTHHEVTFTPEEGLNVLPKVIYHLESYDPTQIKDAVGKYLLNQHISENFPEITLLFTGLGADEVAQGNASFLYAPSPEAADKESRRSLRHLYHGDLLIDERIPAAFGLSGTMRFPFLDHHFVAFYLSLPAENRQPVGDMSKFTLRQAFHGSNLIPEEVLWRKKELFTYGKSSLQREWTAILCDKADAEVSDEELETAEAHFPFNTPRTKEALYYRRIFEELFPGQEHLISNLWSWKWVSDNELAKHQ